MFNLDLPFDEEFDEEIIRPALEEPATIAPQDTRNGRNRQASPALSEASVSSRFSDLTVLAQPKLSPSSPEMLMQRFDKSTCGILSVKDGPTENPWRTLIWPIAKDSPALYHAIYAMTAFHGALEDHDLHHTGVAHMTKSIKKLSTNMTNMRLDAALATSLALAFGEGWDNHVTTGIQHLHGAKIMVNTAVAKHHQDLQTGQLGPQDAMRIRFLCNTFIYMDVIAKLTSLQGSGGLDLHEIVHTVNQPMGDLLDVDPLMGCGVTLFPIIGDTARLIQQVRRRSENGLAIMSQAMELSDRLVHWKAQSQKVFERPEDPSSEVQHSIQTAEAYRYAMLLYLHQAVPEIPMEECKVLARKALMAIASVPLTSRAIIVQIFPLLAAGCEMTLPEDRKWIEHRWTEMLNRLRIGNVQACMKLTSEVWARRDAFEKRKQEMENRRMQARGVPNGDFVPPSLNSGKRKARTTESFDEDEFFGGMNGAGAEQNNRPPKAPRRVTFDTVGANGLPTGSMPQTPRSPDRSRRLTNEVVVNLLEEEYTVRGNLHWLGVMQEYGWEGKSHTLIKLLCCKGLRAWKSQWLWSLSLWPFGLEAAGGPEYSTSLWFLI